jgi:hypothetical protein
MVIDRLEQPLGDLMNRKLITAAATALAVVALSACGSSTDAKPAAGGAVAGGAVDGQAVATKMADAMIGMKAAHTTLSIDGTPIAEGDFSFSSPPQLTMKVSQPIKLQIVQVGGVTYFKGIPGMTASRPWFKLDPKATDAFSKAMSSVGDLPTRYDPRALVSMLGGIKGRDMGTAQVGGVSTRHYAFEVPLSAHDKVLSPQQLKGLQGLTSGPIATDYWVGDDNLPRKVTSVIPLRGKKPQSTEMTYSDWGKPVSIIAPPAAQVGTPPRK